MSGQYPFPTFLVLAFFGPLFYAHINPTSPGYHPHLSCKIFCFWSSFKSTPTITQFDKRRERRMERSPVAWSLQHTYVYLFHTACHRRTTSGVALVDDIRRLSLLYTPKPLKKHPHIHASETFHLRLIFSSHTVHRRAKAGSEPIDMDTPAMSGWAINANASQRYSHQHSYIFPHQHFGKISILKYFSNTFYLCKTHTLMQNHTHPHTHIHIPKIFQPNPNSWIQFPSFCKSFSNYDASF